MSSQHTHLRQHGKLQLSPVLMESIKQRQHQSVHFFIGFYVCEFVGKDRWRNYALDRGLMKGRGKKENGIWARISDWNSFPFMSVSCLT
jgi:hypothetical protein